MFNSLVRGAIEGLVATSIRHRAVVFVVAIALLVASVYAAVTHLEINTDSEGMLSRQLPFQQRMLDLRAAFPTARDTVAIIVDSPLPDAADAVVEALVAELSGREAIASAFAPSADDFMRTHGFLFGDEAALAQNLSDLEGAAPLIAALREEESLSSLFAALARMHGEEAVRPEMLDDIEGAMAEVIAARAAGADAFLSWQRLFDPTGEATARRIVQVLPELDYSQFQPAATARDSVFAAIGALDTRLDPAVLEDVEVSVTGDPILRFDELQSVSFGIELSLSASLVAVIILLTVCYRSVSRMVVTIVSLLAALVYALGFASVALGPLNLVSIAFVVPLVGLGLDFAIHVLVRVGEEERMGLSRFEAFRAAARGVGLALALSAFTTAAAFLSFVGTDFVGMGQVGIIGSVGVLIAFLLSVTLVPALASIGTAAEPHRVAAPHGPTSRHPLAPFRAVASLVIAGLAAASLFVVDEVRFDTDPIELRDPGSPSMIALNKLFDDPDAAPYRLSLVGTQDEVEAFADAVRDLPEVGEVVTPGSLVPDDQEPKIARMREAFTAARDAAFAEEGTAAEPAVDAEAALREALDRPGVGPGGQALKDALAGLEEADRAAASEGLFTFFRPLLERLEVQRLAQPFTFNDLPEPLRERFRAEDGAYRADVAPAADISEQDALRAFVDAVVAVEPDVSGPPLSISRAGEVVSGAMVQATTIAGLIVLATCLVVLRSFSATLSVVVPLVATGLILCGATVLFDIRFNYANVIVLPLIIGLGVDSAIHLALRYREGAHTGIYGTSTPRAVTFSALTTAVAFASLALSSHRGTASMGELLALSIAIVLASTLVLTPMILSLFEPRESS